MSDYAFIVGATKGYTPELCALLNSLDYVGSKADVFVLGIQLPREFVNQFNKLNYAVYHINIQEDEWQAARGRSEIVCRKRYWYAAELGRNYKAVCILDADLIFCRDPVQFFKIAADTGYILGPSKEQNKVYDDPHHEVSKRFMRGKSFVAENPDEANDMTWPWGDGVSFGRGVYNDKDLCNCPVFLDANVWDEALKFSWEVFIDGGFRAPDMDAMNLAFLQFGAHNRIVKLPGLQWLGTNEQLLKPYIRAVERRGNIWTECGLEIFSYHGQYYKEKWRKQQLSNRHHCAEGYLKATENSDAMAAGAMNLLYEIFLRMLDWKIQIEKKEYLND